jgi:hypothetical protein
MLHYRVHKMPPLDPILCQMNTVHIFTRYLRSILILYAHLRLGLLSYPLYTDRPTYIYYNEQ